MNEFQLIKNFFLQLTKNNKSSLNLNDDVFFNKSRNLVISVDTYNEGIHFIDFKKPDLVIKKIIRSSISDLICKGVEPKYYFISGSGNNKCFTLPNLKKISKSLKQEQEKFNISLCGGDTVFSKKLSFTIISLGFSKKIIFRNKAKLNDDIYVTGNLGDSYIGLEILKKKYKVGRNLKRYFENKYYQPTLNLHLAKKLFLFANTSIDISDGLIDDLNKLINKQSLNYTLLYDRIPVSQNLKKFLISKKLSKKSFISQGDDYQILFTADSSKSKIISKIAQSSGIKISKIGKITSSRNISQILDQKGKKIAIKEKGYLHKF
tara:strand:- start:130 stop:1089 length:960 start_codon:yes stop_codon:yes gene_type:complete